MVKKFFLLLLVAMLNVVAWADAGFVITPYRDGEGHYVNYNETTEKYFGDAGSVGFREPAVQITMEGTASGTDITSRYILTYKIGTNEPVNDGRGVSTSTDPTTKSTVESNYGQVSLGKAGEITVNISAVRRSGFTAEQAPAVTASSYTITINALTTTHNIVPAFNTAEAEAIAAGCSDGQLFLNTVYANGNWNAVTSILPKYSVVVGDGVSRMDVTDRFTVNITFATIGGGTQRINLSSDKKTLSFAQVNSPTIDGSKSGILTYEFTPQAEYDGIYAAATKKIYVKLNEISAPLPENEKYTLNATLDASSFFQENITTHEEDNLPQINIYKYGLNDAGTGTHDQYSSPVPTLSYEGTVYPQWSTNGGGQWGDFRMVYVVESDESEADDCQYIPFNTSPDNIKPAGQRTGLTIGANTFQVGGLIGTGYAAGLIKVKGYAILENEEWYGATQKALFKQQGTVTENGTDYPYYATVEFYINVMKRKPQVMISPDPKGLVFGVGDVITMNERFDIYGYKSGDDSNGIEGVLVFDPSEVDENGTKKWGKYGNEVDKLSYSFFISRTQQTTKIAISDWPLAAGERTPENIAAWEEAGGDQYSYLWRYPSPYTYDDKVAIAKGDYIRVDEGTSGAEEIEGNWYIKITDANISDYLVYTGTPSVVDEANSTHPYLTENDLEGGIMYNSMKGYGNESWTMTFKQAGEYDIPYLLHQYNHVRWDSSDIKTYHYSVRSDIAAELKLSYYYTVARKGDGESFTEPDATVVLPNLHDHDVTEDFDITYSMSGVTPTHNETYKEESGWDKYVDATTGTILYTKTGKEEVVIGSTATGQVTITAHATKKSSVEKNYNTVSDKSYVINIVDANSMAQWEVISYTGRGCEEHDEDPDKVRYTNMEDAYGRMHFLPMEDYNTSTAETRRNAGLFYGGTVITGVPGIEMTVGAAPASAEAATADWQAIVPSAEHLENTKKCCSHEDATVVVKPTLPIEFDETGELPKAGAFYKFEPKVNGFLTVDGKFSAGHTIVLIAYINGSKVDDILQPVSDRTDNHTFELPLIAGETYYLYDVTESTDLNIHGFSYQPAFLKGTEKYSTWTEPYTATTFKNSLSNGVPKLLGTSYSHVDFSVVDHNSPARVVSPNTVDDYLTVGTHDGLLNPKDFTIDGTGIFNLKVNAAVSSTLGSSYSDCTKNPYYYINILDIPTYKVVKTSDSMSSITAGSKVSTTNIKTDITMTFGALGNPNAEKTAFGPNNWTFKVSSGTLSSVGIRGVADRIGNPTGIDDDPTYNKTIDGFQSFYAGDINPYDENGNGALQGTTKKVKENDVEVEVENPRNNGQNYTYGSGVGYEQDENFFYNTTYCVPSRGSFLKFEPRESGTLLVYLVQNGSCDYYNGVTSGDYGYLKWRPVYITDETGKPVTMVNSFDNVSQYLPLGTDMLNAGSYTEGLSRCSKDDSHITEAVDKMDGCTFDWSKFKGTPDDRFRLLDAWPDEGERESIIRLDNGGFVLAHKAYVRYTFEVKAGKTYFVFQPGSKIEFGGFSFVPVGFPDKCKYTINSTAKSSTKTSAPADEYVYDPTAPYYFNTENQEKNWNGGAAADAEVTIPTTEQTAADAQSVIADKTTTRDYHFTWDRSSTLFTADKENLVITINDRRNSEIASNTELKERTFSAGVWESICLPFSVSEQEMTRVFGTDYVLVTCDGLYEDTKDLLFVRHANRYVEAGRPYLLKPTESGVFSFRNVTIEGGQNVNTYGGSVNKLPNPTRFNLGVNDNEFVFKGTYMRETVPAGSYFVYSDASHGDALYRYSSDLKIGGYRAYFQKQTLNPAASLSNQLNVLDVMFLVEDSGEVTEVLAISEDGTVNSLPKNAGVYTVDGQKVSDSTLDLKTLPSGLYIINGKKYIK